MCAAMFFRFQSFQAGSTLRYTPARSPSPYQPTPKPSPFVSSAPMREWRLWYRSEYCPWLSNSSIRTGVPE